MSVRKYLSLSAGRGGVYGLKGEVYAYFTLFLGLYVATDLDEVVGLIAYEVKVKY